MKVSHNWIRFRFMQPLCWWATGLLTSTLLELALLGWWHLNSPQKPTPSVPLWEWIIPVLLLKLGLSVVVFLRGRQVRFTNGGPSVDAILKNARDEKDSASELRALLLYFNLLKTPFTALQTGLELIELQSVRSRSSYVTTTAVRRVRGEAQRSFVLTEVLASSLKLNLGLHGQNIQLDRLWKDQNLLVECHLPPDFGSIYISAMQRVCIEIFLRYLLNDPKEAAARSVLSLQVEREHLVIQTTTAVGIKNQNSVQAIPKFSKTEAHTALMLRSACRNWLPILCEALSWKVIALDKDVQLHLPLHTLRRSR